MIPPEFFGAGLRKSPKYGRGAHGTAMSEEMFDAHFPFEGDLRRFDRTPKDRKAIENKKGEMPRKTRRPSRTGSRR